MPVAVALVVSLLALSGVASAQMVSHGTAHEHHQSATHANVLCSWMCAAGQGLEGIVFVFESHASPVGQTIAPAESMRLEPALPASASRGPPTILL